MPPTPGLGDSLGDNLGDDLGDDLGGTSSIQSIYGSALRMHGEGSQFTPGTPPDVATIPNLAEGVGFGDFIQGTVAARVHSGTVMDFPAFICESGATDLRQATGSLTPDEIITEGDLATISFVFNVEGTSGAALFKVFNVGFAKLMLIIISGNLMRVRWDDGNSGTPDVTASFTDPGSKHILQAFMRTSEVAFAIDGGSESSLAASGGSMAFDRFTLPDDSYADDSNIFEFMVARNPTADQDAAALAFLQAKYGL